MIVPLEAGSRMRVKLIEGMALSKAIVATKTAAEGIPAKHGEHLLITADKDAEAFVNCVASLIENQDYARTLGRHARDFVEAQFDNAQITSELLNFYRELIATFSD